MREALDSIERQGRRIGARLKIAGEDWVVTQERGRLVYQDEDGLLDLPPPRLLGRHQFDNAGAAVAALRACPSLEVPTSAYEAGLTLAEWPARMQRLPPGRLTDLAPEGCELWLDGGHNPDGGRAIAAALADLEERVSRPLLLIIGMLANKDAEGFLGNFAGLARRVIAIPVEGQEKAMPQDVLADTALRIGLPSEARESLRDALRRTVQLNLDPPPRILITGSLYLAGDVLSANGTPPA
jgi:dihydrofolate synthase/folylpolyglutamate synthase